MGLKNLRDLPFTSTVQPVAIVGDHSELTPAYRPPQAMFSATAPSAAGLRATVEVASLDEGGCVVGVFYAGQFTNSRAYTTLVPTLVAAPLVPTIELSFETPLSTVRIGTAAASGLNGFTLQGNPDTGRPLGPWYIPRGRFLTLQADSDNINFVFSVDVRGIPATEHGPS